MATTKAKEYDDNDKKTTSTISLPEPPTTTMTTATTATTTPPPPTSPNKLKDLPPIQDHQSSGGDESIVSSTFFNPAEQSTGTLFLPLPNTSANKSRSSFVLSDDELPPEIGNADISIASESAYFFVQCVALDVSEQCLGLTARFPIGRRDTTRNGLWTTRLSALSPGCSYSVYGS
jgi:hypothetical protein